MNKDFLNEEFTNALSYYIKRDKIAKKIDKNILLDIEKTEETYGLRLVRKTKYNKKFVSIILDIEGYPIVEVLTNNKETHYYPCVDIYNNEIIIQIGKGSKKLSEIGKGNKILWYQNIRPNIEYGSEDAKKVVLKALSYVGFVEKPLLMNQNIFNRHYFGKEQIPDWFLWCVSFIWDIFRMCGLSDIFYNGNKTGYCGDIIDWGIKDGLIVKGDLKPGDLLIFHWEHDKEGFPSHIAIYMKKNSQGKLICISGNTGCLDHLDGGYVNVRLYDKKTVMKAVRPNYK